MDGLALPAGAKSGPNCGVTAAAIAAGCTFPEAWQAFEAVWHAQGKRVGGRKGWTTFDDLKKVLRLLGLTFVEERIDGFTLRDWAMIYPDRGRTYIVRTSGHIQVFRNGQVIDQHGPRPITAYWGRNKRVSHTLEIKEVEICLM